MKKNCELWQCRHSSGLTPRSALDSQGRALCYLPHLMRPAGIRVLGFRLSVKRRPVDSLASIRRKTWWSTWSASGCRSTPPFVSFRRRYGSRCLQHACTVPRPVVISGFGPRWCSHPKEWLFRTSQGIAGGIIALQRPLGSRAWVHRWVRSVVCLTARIVVRLVPRARPAFWQLSVWPACRMPWYFPVNFHVGWRVIERLGSGVNHYSLY